MLAKLRSSASQLNSPKTEANAVSNESSNAHSRTAKLRKRKKAKSASQLDKRASAIEFSSSKSSLVPPSPTNVSSEKSDAAVGPLKSNEPVEITQPSHRDLIIKRNPDSIAAPHQNTSSINAPPQTDSTSTVQKANSDTDQGNGNLSPRIDEPKPRRRRPRSDTHRYSTCMFKRSPAESLAMSPLSALKRRFSYSSTSTTTTSYNGFSE